MKKIIKFLSSAVVLSLGLFLFASEVYADLAPLPGPISSGDNGNIVMIGVGVGVGAVALVSWLVIRAIKRKKNVVSK